MLLACVRVTSAATGRAAASAHSEARATIELGDAATEATRTGNKWKKCAQESTRMSQIPQWTFAAGDRIRVRGDRWRIDEVLAFPDCSLLRLSGIGEANRGTGCALLSPFDRPTPLSGPVRMRVVRRRRWMRALRAVAAVAAPFGQLRAAALADFHVYPYQLEPALAVVRGASSRLLLADEVGLGKTIQAGLILAELRERGWANRTLILTPAGLRDQWAGELAHRFDIHAAIMDACAVRQRTSRLPAGVNPWAVEPVSIASIDAIKRPETVQALAAIVWDLLLIDEAHQVATAPLRAAAVRALGERARRIVLLTATPHAGDDAAFAALCRTGQLKTGDPILLFRRARKDVGLIARRRVHLLPVALAPAELHMHRLLREYAARVWRQAGAGTFRDSRLVAIVLTKRALSSASSLARSVERRLQLLPSASDGLTQPTLPLEPSEGELDEADADPALVAPGLADPGDEQASLTRILQAARLAALSERKLLALRRLLQRVREPAIVFTEYRDTLAFAARALEGTRRSVALHGGLDEGDRRAALEAFDNGTADVLLATDTGGEGLNLHARCRFVINLELPWNPMRLEQRIGRVDRIGQVRTVHAVHLFARETSEGDVLARLFRRLERARTTLGSVSDPVSSVNETVIAAAVIEGTPLEPAPATEPTAAPQPFEPYSRVADLRVESGIEAQRLLQLRRSIHDSRGVRAWRRTIARDLADLDCGRVPVTSVALRKLRGSQPFRAGPALVWVFRAQVVQLTGRCLEELVVPVRLAVSGGRAVRSSREARTLAERLFSRLGRVLTSRAETVARGRLIAIAHLHQTALRMEYAREQAIRDVLLAPGPHLLQAGLFEDRAIRSRDQARSLEQSARAEVESRILSLDGAQEIQLARPPELAMVLIVHDCRA
jgi:superfamily II DNA or RNA helicase